MNSSCDYCRGPINGSTFQGRPRPNRPAATYCCYGCLSLGEVDRDEQQSSTTPRLRLDGFTIRLGIGLLVAGQSMIFGLAINLEEHTSQSAKFSVQGIILIGTLVVLALLGPPLFRNAVSEIRHGRLTIEALFLLTMTGAMAASLQSFISGQGPIYFEVVSVLLVVYALGKAIGAHSRATALAATRRWTNSLSTCRIVDRQGRDREMDVGMVLPGDIVSVRPGETIAVDGLVRSGIGFVSAAPVNGEPFAVVKRPGDAVLAGMSSHDATFHIEATASGPTRQIDQLLEAVERARAWPVSLQAQADRLGKIFFPLIAGAAVLAFAIWTLLAGWQTGLFNAMSVLLVACPCALGLATPIVIWSALNRLAERGLVAHSGDIIERLAQVDQVFFDKTGTLTEDQFALVDIATIAAGSERAQILGWMSLVEEQSRHPIARPFAHLPKPLKTHEITRVVSVTVIPGSGVEATIERTSQEQLSTTDSTLHRLRIGRPEWIDQSKSADEATLLSQLRAHAGQRIDCEIDGRLAAIAILTERLRDSVPETLVALRQLGLTVNVLTGDAPERAAALGLPRIQGGLLPADKHRRMIEVKQAGGKPLMIGDGVNDASALAAAHAGIALSCGADLANSAAAATLHHGDLRTLPWAIALSREAVRTVRHNLWRAACYNLLGITLAACGVLHPVAAALLMVVSSLLVAWSSVRVGIATGLSSCGDGACSPATTSAIPDQCWLMAMIHASALATQAIVAVHLLNLSSSAAVVAFLAWALVGLATARAWLQAATIPHWLDMTYGMLTLGNLGMLLGWWADNGFAPLHNAGCCECVNSMRNGLMKPWMWLGMLIFANLGMTFLGRRSHPEIRWCRLSMLSGGNLGMVGGMVLGGWLASCFETASLTLGVLASFTGMTLGMIGGMLIGAELTRRGIVLFARVAETLTPWAEKTKPLAQNNRPI